MTIGTNIHTYFEGTWHKGDVPIIRAADHAAWLGSTVFDGARYFEGLTPDLLAHCERTNTSARALLLDPTHDATDMVQIVREGLKFFAPDAAVYIRPMYWCVDGGFSALVPKDGATSFSICLEEMPMAAPDAAVTLTTTEFRRPVLESAVVNAKAGCLYPNNARMLAEAQRKGYHNTLVLDAMGNVAETASSNIFMVRDGEVFTPIPNGTFLAGITRARHIKNLRADGVAVHEAVLILDDFRDADEVFMTGNMSKITPVSEFDGTHYASRKIATQARDLYWDWAHSEKA